MVKIYKGIPYTGTLPAVIAGTKAGYLHRYKVYGNLTQNGTPTPENPIYPSECGERTRNLFSGEFSQFNNVGGTGSTYAYFYIPEDFTLTLIAKDTHIIPSNTYLGITKDGGQSTGGFTWAILQGFNVTEGKIFTVESSINGYHYVSMYLKAASTLSWILEHYYVMLNLGSTPLPYEPYGYKMPLLSGSTPVDIYLGESQTTRRIKKLVLDGTETPASITQTTDGNNYCVAYKYSDLGMTDIKDYDKYTPLCPYPVFVSSHFTMKSIEGLPLPNDYNDIQPGQVGCNTWVPMAAATPTYNRYIIFCVSGITTINDFKAYLAQQYASGTPVTIWYVLATEETGTLNEPLRKIGDYADTIDSTQTTAQIPTTANSTTISWAGSGLAPSEFDSIAEWVSATPKIYTNGAWTDAQTYVYDDGTWVADNSN